MFASRGHPDPWADRAFPLPTAELSDVGAADDVVAALAEEALRHRAVRHPYLQALAAGAHPDPLWALGDFARHYLGYSRHFSRFLTTVIERLDDPGHRTALLANLSEESGVYADAEVAELRALGVEREWIDGVPHPQLFRRFAAALGVDERRPEAVQVACWRECLFSVLAHGSPAEAVGALGLGTEHIVRTMYGHFVAAIDRLGTIAPRDAVFFVLHTAVDDHHQATLRGIAVDYAMTTEGTDDLRRGMLKALQLRSAFWDWLHERALDPAHADLVP
jgi:pyrroloquinoline quinone (PQQ) biosynthesis protein C